MVVVLDGLLVAAELGLGMTATQVGSDKARIELNRPIVVGDGLLAA